MSRENAIISGGRCSFSRYEVLLNNLPQVAWSSFICYAESKQWRNGHDPDQKRDFAMEF